MLVAHKQSLFPKKGTTVMTITIEHRTSGRRTTISLFSEDSHGFVTHMDGHWHTFSKREWMKVA
jgi:hypothetical protein